VRKMEGHIFLRLIFLIFLSSTQAKSTSENINTADRLDILEARIETCSLIENELIHLKQIVNNQTLVINELREQLDYVVEQRRIGTDVVNHIQKRAHSQRNVQTG